MCVYVHTRDICAVQVQSNRVGKSHCLHLDEVCMVMTFFFLKKEEGNLELGVLFFFGSSEHSDKAIYHTVKNLCCNCDSKFVPLLICSLIPYSNDDRAYFSRVNNFCTYFFLFIYFYFSDLLECSYLWGFLIQISEIFAKSNLLIST